MASLITLHFFFEIGSLTRLYFPIAMTKHQPKAPCKSKSLFCVKIPEGESITEGKYGSSWLGQETERTRLPHQAGSRRRKARLRTLTAQSR